MKNIYPKTDSKLRGIHALKKYIDKYKGVEIQLLSFDEKECTFFFEEEIRTICDLFPNIKEITVHPPISFCVLEQFLYKKEEIVLSQLEKAALLSEELGIHINILYHTNWALKTHKLLTFLSIRKMLNQIKGYDVYILLENGVGLEKEACIPLEICRYFGEKQLKVCLDICHVHCNANLLDQDIHTYMDTYIQKKDALKYVHQIHFSEAVNHDGYKDKKTHGVAHKNRKDLFEDMQLLYEYGMYNCNFITEINEKNYDERQMQIKEIETLEDIYKMMQNEYDRS